MGELASVGSTKADDIAKTLKELVAKNADRLDDVKAAGNAAENVLEAGAKNLDETADAAAEGSPHTSLGGKISSETGEVYRQSATFPSGTWPTANGQNVPCSEVHWTDYGTPHHHTDPHQHIFEYNPDKGGWIRKGSTIFES